MNLLDPKNLPKLFVFKPQESMAKEEINLVPLNKHGRIGAEIHSLYSTIETGCGGPAAAIVRYLPGATAALHNHLGYEIIYILEGELKTAEGVFLKNSIILMEPNTRHAPRSEKGCLALVIWEKPVEVVQLTEIEL